MRRPLLHPGDGRASDVITYDCSYCKEPHANFGWLQLNGRGSFCTWECVLAQGLFLTWANNEQRARQHRDNVNAQAGRCVNPAPAPKYLARYNNTKGLRRTIWLPLCRGELSWAEANIALKEPGGKPE